MNDLGIALAWLAVQVTLVLVPALALHAFASRRGPAAGAWIAALSLGLIAALCVVELTARPGRQIEAPAKTTASAIPSRTAATSSEPPLGAAGLDRPSPTAGLGWEFSGLRLAWDRIERGAAEPAARVRPWGGVVALVALGGMAFGLVRLLTGLWAVGVYRRRGRIINDPAMNELLDALRIEMGCVRTVELRETAELTTAATAGWR
ncbi:MAG: antirepressor regulating drug resistance protein, partial [Paludisphaera borealis]|nr:antirepressor regulating drug resistance protein [Paludisphaera borealis]